MFLFVALVSVLVPLSFCVVPSLARLTTFPLLTALVNRFASAYLQPCLKIEYGFGAWEDRPGAPSGTTITLFFVKLADAFLKTLAFAKQGVAPAALHAVAIKKLTLHFTMAWKVVLEIEDVDVDATIIDPNVDGVFEVNDAVVMKANEATQWLQGLITQKTKDEQQQQLDAAMTPGTAPRAFSFKDRIVQHVMAQIDVKITNVRVNVTSEAVAAAQPTRVTAGVSALTLTSRVQHENEQEGLELVLTSKDIRVLHTIHITDFGVYTQQFDAAAIAAVAAPSATEPSDSLKPGPGDSGVALFALPEVELKLDVPPMARVLAIVENIAPIPFAKRVCRVELVLSGTNRVTFAREPLTRVLRDLYVPYMDHQTLVKSVRVLECDKTACKTLTDADRAFYVENFGKVDTNSALSAVEKTARNAKLLEIESIIALDDIVKLRSRALGLATHFRAAQQELSLADVVAVTTELASRPANIPFQAMQIALRLESFSVGFVETDAQVAELVFSSFGVNVVMFAAPSADADADADADAEKRTQEVDMQLEAILFVVNSASTASGPAASPASKLVFTDLSNVATPSSDALVTRPQVLAAHVVRYASGKQVIAASLSHLQLIAAADALEYFLMSLDRLNTSTGQAMAAAHPAFETIVPVESAGPETMSDGHESASASSAPKLVSMAPFSLLGGKELELTLSLDDCHIVLTPARSFAKSFYSDVDVTSASRSSTVINCRVDLPLSLRVAVSSTRTHESIELVATNVGMLARYLDSSDDDASEALLVPTSFSVRFSLEQDAANALLCYEKVAMQMPDCVFAFSDLSLALMASCVQALSSVQTTTVGQAQLKRASLQQQVELRRQAELDVILSRMRRLFEDIDTNQNGQIELNELLLLLRRVKVGDSLLESELEYFVRVLFNEIDRDGNGYLEFDELRAFLRDDLLMTSDADVNASASASTNSSNEYAGTSDLSGFLNLRGAEYRSTQVLEKLCDATITTASQFCDFMATSSSVQARFWDLFAAETRIVNHSLGTQSPLDVQKKLVRLLKNYDAAQYCWESFVAPSLDAKSQDALVTAAWIVQPFTPCGGVSEYQSAARVIAKRKRDGIFSAALSETEQLVQLATKSPAMKKQLHFATDIQLGNLRFVLTDAELPARYCRGDFNVKDVTVSVELTGKDIDETGPVDWVELATSESAQWTALFGVHLSASCFSEIADDMESVIEPWELAAGFNSVEGENGFSVLVEAAKRFQINVTPGLLKTYRTLMDVLDGEAEQNALQQHQESGRSALSARATEGADCLVQNYTGVAVSLTLNGVPNEIVVAPNASVYVARSTLVDGKATLDSLKVAQWGATVSAVQLPQFGSVNVPVASYTTDEEAPASTLFVTAFCRLEDPQKQRVVLKSNLYFCNHSSQVYEVKYLALGGEGRAAITSQVFTLRPNERMSLPLGVLMGITELYARPQHFDQWIIKASLNNDVLTSRDAINELRASESTRAASTQQHRDGTIMFGETDESCMQVLKQLAPNMLVRRWHLRTHFEWEVSLLPPFVVRNSLPYKIEYRFVEYQVKAAKNVNAEFGRLEKVLRDEVPALESDNVLTGAVASGQDTEIAGVSCLAPGYISIRVVATSSDTASPWSKAMLMAIHAPVEQFSIARELINLSNGAQFSVDRLSLPSLPRVVRFFSPYWIVNSTSFDFALASTAPGAKPSTFEPLEVPSAFTHPIITSLANNRLSLKPIATTGTRPVAWDALGAMPMTAFGVTPSSDDIVARAKWSEPMNTTTINTVGEFVCGPAVFAVKVEGLFGMFEPGVGLTLSPRFFVQNRTKEALFVQSFGASETDAEKVTDQFRKRSTVDVGAFQIPLTHGETTPVYHFAPLKRGDELSKCQKFMSVSFTSEWDSDAAATKWSFAIPINVAGDVYVQMYSPTRQKDIICQASVQVIDMYVYVVITDASSAPPYRIENYTPFTIECAQLGESSMFRGADKEKCVTVNAGEWHAFAWYNPLSKDRDVEVRVSHRDAVQAKTKKYDIDYVGYHESLTIELALEPGGDKTSSAAAKKKYEIVVQVVVDESTRVFKFVEKDLELSRLESRDAALENEFQQRKMLYASSFDIRLAGFGLSLLDAYPQEVFFASLDVLTVQKPPSSLEWVFSIFNLQLDDMLACAKFPVILNPIDAGYSDHSVGKTPKPLLRLVLDADLAAKVGTYKLLDVDLSSVSLKIDIDYVVNLVKLLEPYLVSDTTVAIRSAATLEKTLFRRVPPVPGMQQLEVDGTSTAVHNDLVYFDVLRIHAISIDLEYSITRQDIVASTGGSGRSVVFGLLSQVIGLVGSNLSGSPSLSFNEIVILRCFSTKQRLQNQLVQNYIRQGVMQAYRLVGSADIIGNPIGLVEDLGSGVMQFLKITKGEVLGDSQTRGEGVKVLGKTIVKSGASTVAKITGSLDRFVGEFADTDDNDNSAGGNLGCPKENDAPTGIAPLDGGIQFAKDFGKGLTGIFTKPVQGAMKGGVTGLVQGTVSGIAGPGVVLLKRLTSTSHSLALGVQSTVVDRSVFGGRRRQPKLIVHNKLIAEFDESHYKPTRLQLEVISANGLLSDDSCDPLCVVRVDNKVVLKTRVLYNTLNPVWQEKTQVELTGGESEVQFVVKDSYGGAIDKTVGKCIVSIAQLREDFKPPEHASNLAEWVKTGVKPDDTKKNVSHQVSEKEYELLVSKSPRSSSALLSLGTSASKLRAAENDYQVIVTIVSLEDLKATSSSGGGVLGLGNLVSSTPNISPYISIHVGANVSRTNTAKINFAAPPAGGDKKTFIGAATWNETFTFPYSSADVASGKTPAAVTFSLKDKSMLHDERLGRATKALDLSTANAPAVVEKLKWTDKGDDTGDVIGYLNVKVEIVSASVGTPDEPAIEVEAEDDTASVPTPKAAATPRGVGALGSIKAGKVRIACEFV